MTEKGSRQPVESLANAGNAPTIGENRPCCVPSAASASELIDEAASEELESRTRMIGHKLFRRARGFQLPWEERLRRHGQRLALSGFMGDEALKFRLLRLIDVFPTLITDGSIARHVREYLSEAPRHSENRGRRFAGLAAVANAPWVPDKVLAWACRRAITTMGSQFIAGHDPISVAPKLRALEEKGYRFTLDLLGEAVTSGSQADRFAGRYREMIEELAAHLEEAPQPAKDDQPRVNVSVKLSSLTHKFDPIDPDGTAERVLPQLRTLFRAAERNGVFLNIDMEQYSYRDLTLQILARLLSEPELAGFRHVGVVMQAYLVDSEPILESWLQWLRAHSQPMTIRLVKGAYWDSEQIWANQKGWPVPVSRDKLQTDARFERMTCRLLQEHDLVRTAVGSHNLRSLAWALAVREQFAVAPERFEVQFLYGMAGSLAPALVGMGYSPRIYVPVGELIPGMAYLVRRILENTANDSFVRQFFDDSSSEEELLADPKAEVGRNRGVQAAS